MRRLIPFWIGSLVIVLFFSACSRPEPPADESILRKPLDELTVEDMERMGAVVETNYGAFRFRFFPREAPNTVKNFLKLVRVGFYDGLRIHRVAPGLYLQGGDPKGDSTGGPGWTIPLERNSHSHVRGAVGMWHAPLYVNDAGSQFYVMIAPHPKMDKTYTVFGEVWQGMDTVDRIAHLPLDSTRGQPGAPLSPVLMTRVRLEPLPRSARP